MNWKRRIKNLEKSLKSVTENPFTDWTDDELCLSIELLERESETGQKQEWPEELAKKQAALPSGPCELDKLSDDELETKIVRLLAELHDWGNKELR